MGQGKAVSGRHPNDVFQLNAVASAARTLVLGAMLAAPAAFAQTSAAATSDDALPTVTVTEKSEAATAPYVGGKVARGGSLGVLGTNDVMDTPFSTTNYTAEGMKNLQARNVSDVVVDDPSVRNQNPGGGFGDAYQMRGLAVSVNDTAFNGLYGLVSLGRMPISMLERVELLKGPATFTSGMGPGDSVGGAINLVSKRATAKPVSSVTATFLGDSQFGGQVDLGRRWGQEGEWGIRVNGLYADGNIGIKGNNQQQSQGSVALDFATSKLRWTLDAYTLHEDTKNYRPQFTIGTRSLPTAPAGDINVYPGSTLQLDDKVVATRLEYDFNDHLSAYGATGYHVATSAQTFPRSTMVNLQGDITGTSYYYDQKVTTTSSDVGLRARFDTFGIGHTVTASVSTIDQQLDTFYQGGNALATNLYNPSPLVLPTVARTAVVPQSQKRLTSVALLDTLSIANGRLLVTGGLRRQQVYSHTLSAVSTDINNRAYSPLVGVVVKPLEGVSLYANYTAGLNSGSIVGAGYTNTGAILAPYKSTQYESGVKLDWGRVMTTAAVFEINKANGVSDGAAVPTYTQDGRQRIRGLELSIVGEVVRGLRVMAGATFFDAKQFHTVRGATDGKDVASVGRRNFNLGVDWDAPVLTGLVFNTRVINTGASYLDAANTISVPSWTRVDLGARYVSKLAGTTVTYRANLENLFNRNYWITQGTYGGIAPSRTLVASATFDF